METIDFCKKHNACKDGAAFAAQFSTLAEVWDACPRADWMIWMLQKADKTGGLERTLRIFACDCAASANPTDPRSLAAISVARRYADGLATADELRSAACAAYAAAEDASADAATFSADASACAAYAAADLAAAFAACASSCASARAASAACASACASVRAADATRKTHAERLRAAIPNPFANA